MNTTVSKLFLAFLTLCSFYSESAQANIVGLATKRICELLRTQNLLAGVQAGCKSVGKLSVTATQGLLALVGGVIAADALGTPSEPSKVIASSKTPIVCSTTTSTGMQTEAPSFNFSPTITRDTSPLDMVKKPSNNPLISSDQLKKIYHIWHGQAPANQPVPQITNPPSPAVTVIDQKLPLPTPKVPTPQAPTSTESSVSSVDCSLTDTIKNKASEIKNSTINSVSQTCSDAKTKSIKVINDTCTAATPYLIAGAIAYGIAGYIYIYGIKRAQAINHWKSLSVTEQDKIPTHAVDHGSRIHNHILDKIFLPFVGWQYVCEKWIGNGKMLFLI